MNAGGSGAEESSSCGGGVVKVQADISHRVWGRPGTVGDGVGGARWGQWGSLGAQKGADLESAEGKVFRGEGGFSVGPRQQDL